MSGLRIGILACDALKDEIESLTEGLNGVIAKEYLDFGYHLDPPLMRKVLVDKINTLEGKVDLVFLGYAYCQSLRGLPEEVRVPVVMLEQEDCIACLLGPEEYSNQKRCGKITWFYPSGWAKYGAEGMVRLFKLDIMRQEGYEPEYFLKMMFEGFSRCLFIDTGEGNVSASEENSVQFAQKLGLKHERTKGTLHNLRGAWGKACALAIETEIRRGSDELAKCAPVFAYDIEKMIGGG